MPLMRFYMLISTIKENLSSSKLNSETMHLCRLIKEKVQSSQADRYRYVSKLVIDEDSDGAHLRSFQIDFQIEGEVKYNARSSSFALQSARQLI